MTTNVYDSDQTERFLTALFAPSDSIATRPLETWTDDAGKKAQKIDWKGSKTYSRDQLITRLSGIGERSHANNTNLFFGVCPRISHDHQRTWQIRQVSCLWADIDDAGTEEALERCESVGLPTPSIAVVSGNGCHLYWLLREPFLISDAPDPPPVLVDCDAPRHEGKPLDKYIEIEGERTYVSKDGKYIRHPHPITVLSARAQQIQFVIQGIAAVIGGDHTHDLARLLRLPGTLNVKNARNGQSPRQCAIDSLDANRRYEFSAFAPFAEKAPRKKKRDNVKLPEKKRLTPERKERFKRLVMDCDESQDRSKADFALLCEAIKQRRPTDEVWDDVQDTSKFAERGRDYFDRTWEKAEEAVIDGIIEAEEVRDSDCPYASTEGGMVLLKPTDFGVDNVRLTNFNARIITEITETDGEDARKLFELGVEVDGSALTITVPAGDFGKLDWVHSQVGARAIIYPGTQVRDHVKAAIQSLSPDIAKRTVYRHLGWREVDGKPLYLHSGGGIGAGGFVHDVHVDAHGCLASFRFPEPISDADELKEAVTCVTGLLDAAPLSVTAPLFAAPYRSVLGPADFSVFLHGRTQSGKTELAALAQQHFGVEMTAAKLPLSWTGTENALEGTCFQAKDALIVIDDFVTKGSRHEISKTQAKAERVLRAQANQQGRSRMNSDSSLRTTKHPRGLILATGEEIPEGESLRSRMFLVKVESADVDWEQLTKLQGQSGQFAKVMSTFIQWVAGNYDPVVGRLKERTNRIRDELQSECKGMMRTPTVTAGLLVGAKMFTEFAHSTGVLRPDEADSLYRRIREGVLKSAEHQRDLQAEENPVDQYISWLKAAIDSGAAHLRGTEGQRPENAEMWGWSDAGGLVPPRGAQIGWTDGSDVYLNQEAAYAVIQMLANRAGTPIGLSKNTMGQRLREHGVLKTTEKHRSTVRKTLGGAKGRRVLHMDASVFGVAVERNHLLFENDADECVTSTVLS